MIQVIGQCVESDNETGARQLFDVLETLLILVRLIALRYFFEILKPSSSALGSSDSWQKYP